MDELECYYTIKSILSEAISPDKVFYKDTYSYFGILFENKVTKWICRVFIKDNAKYIVIPNDAKEEIRYDIESSNDIYKYKNELINRLNSFLR